MKFKANYDHENYKLFSNEQLMLQDNLWTN